MERELCPDCGYVRWDCRCLADALKRIAELGAMFRQADDFRRIAEAEVERLTEELRYCHAGHPKGPRNLFEAHPPREVVEP